MYNTRLGRGSVVGIGLATVVRGVGRVGELATNSSVGKCHGYTRDHIAILIGHGDHQKTLQLRAGGSALIVAGDDVNRRGRTGHGMLGRIGSKAAGTDGDKNVSRFPRPWCPVLDLAGPTPRPSRAIGHSPGLQL